MIDIFKGKLARTFGKCLQQRILPRADNIVNCGVRQNTCYASKPTEYIFYQKGGSFKRRIKDESIPNPSLIHAFTF